MKQQVSLPGFAVPSHSSSIPTADEAAEHAAAEAPACTVEAAAAPQSNPVEVPRQPVAENRSHNAAPEDSASAADAAVQNAPLTVAAQPAPAAAPDSAAPDAATPEAEALPLAEPTTQEGQSDEPTCFADLIEFAVPAASSDATESAAEALPVNNAATAHAAACGMSEQDDWPPMSEMLQSFFVFEPTTAAPEPITVMGLDCARPRGLAGLAEEQRKLAEKADVICAGRMLLEEFSGRSLEADDAPPAEAADVATQQGKQVAPAFKARLLPLTTPLEPLLTRLSQLRAAGERVLVLADGDPLLFGIGATLVRRLGADAVHLLPAVSSLQQACARLSLPWHKVICLSLHGRDDLRPLNVACGKNAPLCILTDARMSPDVLARHLLDRGVDWFDAHIFERMGAEDEAVSHLSLAEAAGREFGPACTMVLIPAAPPRRPHLGLDADQLAVDRGLITKKPVRAAALALLRIEAGHVVWDIGSGSGAVALEASVLAHEGRVIAVERSAGRAMGIQENRRRFGAANVEVRLGQAPECLPALPDPQRVFIGGGLSGDDGDDILGHVCLRLPVGGRVVVSCVLLDSISLCRRFFEDLAWPVEILQLSAAEGKTLGGDVHLAAMNPVFLLAAQKPAPAPIQSGAQPEGR